MTIAWGAIYGAILSTLLALVRLWEFWGNRFRIEVGKSLTSSSQFGNEIFIRNLSGYPVTLTYWEILSRKGCWPLQRHSILSSHEIGDGDSQIEAHSSFTLKFEGCDYFNCMTKNRVFIRLDFAGRRSVERKIYG